MKKINNLIYNYKILSVWKKRLNETNRMRKLMDLPLITESVRDFILGDFSGEELNKVKNMLDKIG